MKPSELFGVGVRYFGLWSIVQGLFYFFYSIDICIELSTAQFTEQRAKAESDFKGYLIYAAANGLVGAILLLRADSVVKLSYRPAVALDSEIDSTTHSDELSQSA